MEKEGEKSNETGIELKADKDAKLADVPPALPKRDYVESNVDDSNSRAREQEHNQNKKLVSFPRRPQFVYKPDSSENWMVCIRNSLLIINLFIWLLGACITALGIWIKADGDFVDIQTGLDIKQFSEASWVFIIVGVIIMIIGAIGCYGVIVSKICVLIIFSIIVGIIIAMEIAVIALVWTATAKESVREDIKLKATEALHNMVKDSKQRYFVELVQSKLKCCGVNGPDDYSKMEGSKVPIPPSCRNPETETPYETGCYDAIIEYLKSKAAIIGGVSVAIFLLQIIVLVCTTCFICSLKQGGSSIF